MTTDYAALLASQNAQRAASRAAAWEGGKPRQRAADKRRRVARAEAAYQAMPKLKPEALPIPNATKAERRPPNPPEGNSGIKAARRASGVPEAPWVNPRPPTPAPGREPFDTLFTDIRNLRGDLRLVRRAIRGNTVPCANRDTLMDKLGSLLDFHDQYKGKRGPLRAARLMLEAVRAILDADIHNRRPARRRSRRMRRCRWRRRRS